MSVMSVERVTGIPPEVIESVIRQSRHITHDLFKMCFVSRNFLYHSRRHLYRNIAISDNIGAYIPPNFPKLGFKKALKLFITLSEFNPSLAGYVDTLYLDGYISERDFSNEDRQHLVRLICTSLRLMVNLKTLSITRSFCDLDIAFTLKGCSFHLESFRYLPSNRRTNNEEYLNNLIDFLHAQPGIMTLHFHWFMSTPFPGSCCSQLEDLRGHTPLIEAALPNLPSVSRLTWFATGNNDMLEFSNGVMIDRLSNLRALTIRNSRSPKIVSSMIHYLNNLQVLHLAGITDTFFYKRDFTHIANLPNLHIFIYSSYFDNITCPLEVNIPTHRRKLTRETKSLVEEWFGTTSSLQYAYFQICNYPRFPKRYLVWEREKVHCEVREVDAVEVWKRSPWI